MKRNIPSSRNIALGLTLSIASLTVATVESSRAADITMTSTNASNTSGFNSGTGWPGAAAPTAGNNYFTGAFILRTPNPTASGNNYVFAGDSLTISSGGRVLGKIGNGVASNTTSGTITIGNLILNGGTLDQAGANTDSSTLIVAGAITVNSASFVGALGAAANNSANFETLNITATIGGSGALTVAGSTNSGVDTGVVKLSAANTYSGTITVATPTSGFVASATNRLLQLNHVNALQNATLNLTSVSNGVSFAPGANTGTFNIGALSGSSNQVLADTASAAVSINVGGSNASASYSGILSGAGSVTKSGTGVQTLSGANTHSGGTLISAGTLTAANASALGSGDVTIAGGILDSTVGSLTGTGNVSLTGGTLDLNATGVGSLSLAADKQFTMSSGTWNLSFASISSFDQIAGVGAATFSFTGGTLVLGGIIDYGASYQILSGFASGSVSGISITGYDTTNHVASLSSAGLLSFTPVPEPSFYGAAMVAALGFLIYRRNRRIQRA